MVVTYLLGQFLAKLSRYRSQEDIVGCALVKKLVNGKVSLTAVDLKAANYYLQHEVNKTICEASSSLQRNVHGLPRRVACLLFHLFL